MPRPILEKLKVEFPITAPPIASKMCIRDSYKATPDEVRFLMIDPKAVELTEYNGLPHMLVPVVTDPHKASGALGWAVSEMMKRYKIFAECNVRNLKEMCIRDRWIVSVLNP